MPFTFAHPAAVLPLRKLCPRYLNLPALMIGSLMPDSGYYLHNWVWSISGHSFMGTLTFDVPAGLLALSVFYLSLRPIASLFPSPHKEAVISVCPTIKLPSIKGILIAALSIFIGAWTHIIWDGFTHANGWCVHKFAAVTPTLFEIDSYKVNIWHLLQHASTIFGLGILLSAYHQYVERQQAAGTNTAKNSPQKLLLLGVLLILPVVLAAGQSLAAFKHGISLPALDAFTFNLCVQSVCYGIPILLTAGIITSLINRLKPKIQVKNSEPESAYNSREQHNVHDLSASTNPQEPPLVTTVEISAPISSHS